MPSLTSALRLFFCLCLHGVGEGGGMRYVFMSAHMYSHACGLCCSSARSYVPGPGFGGVTRTDPLENMVPAKGGFASSTGLDKVLYCIYMYHDGAGLRIYSSSAFFMCLCYCCVLAFLYFWESID